MPVTFADAHGQPLEQIFNIPSRTQPFLTPSWHLGRPVTILLDGAGGQSSGHVSRVPLRSELSSDDDASKRIHFRAQLKVEHTLALMLSINEKYFCDASLVAASRLARALRAEATLRLQRRWATYVHTVLNDASTLPVDAVPKGMRAAGLRVALGAMCHNALVAHGSTRRGARAFGCDYDGELCLGVGASGCHWGYKWHGSMRPCLNINAEEIVDVSLMHRHALFVTSAGDAWICGLQYLHPRRRIESPERLLTGITGIRICMASAGFNHTALLANDGRVFTFGEGQLGTGGERQGQLGRGENVERSEHPREVTALSPEAIGVRVAGVAAGKSTTFAYDTLGRLWACGKNGTPQEQYTVTGHGLPAGQHHYTFTPKPVSVLIEAGANIVRVSAGLHHVLALDSKGQIWAWGRNANGELGLGDNMPHIMPELVSRTAAGSSEALPQFVSIAAGVFSSSAVGVDGTAWMWGDSRRCVGLQAPVHLRLRRTPRGLGRRPAVWPHRPRKEEHIHAPIEALQFRGEGILRVVAGSMGTVLVSRGGACFVVGPNGQPTLAPSLYSRISPSNHAPNFAVSKLEVKSPRPNPAWSWRLGV